jgi:hypothetical protein
MRDNDSLILEGAYLEVLEESRKKRYLEMFKGIPERYEAFYQSDREFSQKNAEMKKKYVIDKIHNDIEWAIYNLKREDRIVWYLRQIKAVHYFQTDPNTKAMVDKLYNYKKTKEDADELNALINKIPEWARKSSAFGEVLSMHPVNKLFEFRTSLAQSLLHFLSLNIPQINNFRFENQQWKDIRDQFRKLEEEWAEKQKSWIDITDELKEGRISPIVVFDDGFRWFNLNRPRCEQEGKAMGHCGNCGGRRDDTVLSLRKLKQEGGRMYARPSLTFILHDNGQLGEMKGRGNKKPNEKYHPYILRLLAQKNLIKGIEGGGYLPENNFSLGDLSDERLEAIFNARPDLQINDETSLRRVVMHYISKDKELPNGFINLQTNNGEWFFPSDIAFLYIQFLIGKGKEVPDILIKSMDPTYSLAFAELMVKNDMEIPEEVFNRISNRIDHSLSLAETLVENNRQVPEALLLSISKDFERAISFVRFLLNKDLEIPETIEKTFATGSTFHAVSYASTMIKANRKVLPAVITNISYDPQSSALIAEYMFRHNYEEIPEILLKSILNNERVTREFAFFLKTQTRELPPILKTFVNLSSKGFI